MPEVALMGVGAAVGLAILTVVFHVSRTPRRPGRRPWLASASGESDDPTKHCPGDPGSLP
jgi:hypothetical protein